MKQLTIIGLLLMIIIGCDPNKSVEQQVSDGLNAIKKERESDSEDWENFVDSGNKFLIGYPSGWEIKKEESVAFAAVRKDTSENAFLDNFHLIIHTIEDSVILKNFAYQYYLHQQEQYSNFTMEYISEGTINSKNDVDSYYIDYSAKQNSGVNMYGYSVFLRVRENIYHLNFYSSLEEKNSKSKLFDKIVASLVIY